jgi:signal transduction histidine kinase/ActR/RegA family two-component response regulator
MPKKNTLTLRIGVGAALLAVFVAVVFVSLIAATNQARRVDRNSKTGSALVTAATAARAAVASAHVADRAAIRNATSASLEAAQAADRSTLGHAAGEDIRSAASKYSGDARRGRGLLLTTLGATTRAEQAEAAQRSSDLSNALSRALLLGIIGLIGSVVSVSLFGIDILRSVTVPVRRAAAAARRLGSGDLATRVPETGVADLKELAQAINTMAGSLENNRKKLEVQHTELVVSREIADNANQAKSEFLSRMSHELRTPLNAILGFAQLLEIDDLSNRQRDNVAHIVAGGKHLLDLINEVLEISRIEAGSMIPVIEPLHAPTVLREAIELVGPLATQRGIELSADLKGFEHVWIHADRQRLKQVLINLLGNAVKYNRLNGSVTVGLKPAENRVRIFVRDTGMGIPQDKLAKLFIPFERLGAEGSEVEGTGLGLVLARRLTEAMNGTLGVESQEWVGSTFYVDLPLAETPAVLPVAEPQPVAPAEPTGAPDSDLEGNWRVLYIEDDAANARLMARLFNEDPRLDLMTTMHGERGLAIASELQPDLILLDIHLPDINGDEVLQRLRAAPESAHIPVIVVSADATDEQRARMIGLGAAHYLTKPLTLNALLSAIWDVLGSPAALLRSAEEARV